MTKRWLVALLIAGLFGGKAFADCVPSPDTPASVIQYFQSFNKPLPEQFCAKEGAASQASEVPSQEPPQAYEDVPESPPLDEPRGHYAQLPPDHVPVPQPMYRPSPYGEWPRHFEFRSHHFRFEWFY
jgi:hypothetical protein